MVLEQNGKVLAMYQAVCDLIDSGIELEKVKVADVTQKAGIGKGTAYEYFRSKDELLFRALQYDFIRQFRVLQSDLKKTKSFHGAIMRGFDWMEKNACNNRMKVQFWKLTENQKEKLCAQNSPDSLKDFFFVDIFHEILGDLVEKGRQEGVINPELPIELVQLDVFSKFAEYFIFMRLRSSSDKKIIEMTRNFIYEGMIRHYEV